MAVSDDVPTALVAWQRYVPESLLEVARTLSVPSVEVGLNVYLEEDEEIVIWDCELEIKIQDIVADGLAETEHGIETSWPVIAVYKLFGIVTDGRPTNEIKRSSIKLQLHKTQPCSPQSFIQSKMHGFFQFSNINLEACEFKIQNHLLPLTEREALADLVPTKLVAVQV